MNNSLNTYCPPVVQEYTEGISKNPNVLGVALTGSASRGNNDDYSDIDMVIFVNLKNSTPREGKFYFKDHFFDVRISELEHLRKTHWSYDMYFAYLYANILYDPKSYVRHLIEKKRNIWQENVHTHIILSLVQLSVIFKFEDNWKGLRADTHYHKSISRDDLVSAHRILNLGFEHILDLFYLLNDNPPPDYKNKLSMLQKMPFASSKSLSLINEFLLTTSINLNDAEKRYQILSEFVELIKALVDSSNKEFPNNFYQYYLQNRD